MEQHCRSFIIQQFDSLFEMFWMLLEFFQHFGIRASGIEIALTMLGGKVLGHHISATKIVEKNLMSIVRSRQQHVLKRNPALPVVTASLSDTLVTPILP